MKRILILSLLMTLACGSDSSKHFTTYIDVNNLRIFARDGVSTTFLNNVGKAYEAIFSEGADIDSTMRSTYLTTCKDQHVFQLVGLVGPENYPDSIDERPASPYEHNATDYIWEMNQGGAEQIGEVLEHLLHTITAVGLYLAYPDIWDYTKSSSPLSLAMQEAIDSGIYDISSYDELKGDTEGYQKTLATEYVYWLILAEWDYFVTAGKKEEGITGNGEFSIGTSAEIASQLPIGHQFYEDHVKKVLSIPDTATITALFP